MTTKKKAPSASTIATRVKAVESAFFELWHQLNSANALSDARTVAQLEKLKDAIADLDDPETPDPAPTHPE